MSHNVDKNELFDFINIASLSTQIEAQREAYWIIAFIFLKKNLKIDIAETFQTGNNQKICALLKDIDIYEFDFAAGFLVHKTRKINLEAFLGAAELIWKEKEKMLTINNQHNLTNVYREKSEMGVFSDYPHFYKIIREGKTEPFLFG